MTTEQTTKQASVAWTLLRPVLGTIATLALSVVGWIAVDVRAKLAVMSVEQRTMVENISDIKDAVEKADGRLERDLRALRDEVNHRFELVEARVHELEIRPPKD